MLIYSKVYKGNLTEAQWGGTGLLRSMECRRQAFPLGADVEMLGACSLTLGAHAGGLNGTNTVSIPGKKPRG